MINGLCVEQDEQLALLNNVAEENIEKEAQISLMLSSHEAYEQEVEKMLEESTTPRDEGKKVNHRVFLV